MNKSNTTNVAQINSTGETAYLSACLEEVLHVVVWGVPWQTPEVDLGVLLALGLRYDEWTLLLMYILNVTTS